MKEINLDLLKFNEQGLLPAVVQDVTTGQVVMLAYVNEVSLQKSIETGTTWFYSRSRQELWNKGATSGNFQKIRDIKIDCDGDAILFLVEQEGEGACHTGHYSCFYRDVDGEEQDMEREEDIFDRLEKTVLDRKVNPKEGSYTNYLFEHGIDKILKKVGEEAGEVIIAAKNPDPGETIYETADLYYHLFVLLAEKGIPFEQIKEELRHRFGKKKEEY